MLHIITPLYRFENLESIYNSILINDDIRWHISKSNKREDLKDSFLKEDKRIIVYNVDCKDEEPFKKRQEVLKNIKDGYFCFLDDDTIFHENMYIKYTECIENNFIGMLIGEQINSNGKIRLVASKPIFRRIDVGNVLSHHSCLVSCFWPSTFIDGVNQRDFLFWESVFKFYGNKCGILNQPISYYNKLRPK